MHACMHMKLFQNQRNILNILEENQARINEIFKKHFNNLMANSSIEDIEDVKSILKTVAENVDSSLNEESVMIEKMYSELLKQYTHEETLHSQSRALTLNEFKSRLSLHLQQNKGQFANDEADNQLLPESLPAAGGYAPHFGPVMSFEDSEEENSLKIDLEGRNITDEGVLNVLDTTGASEGMLEDFERNEQIKEILITSYPNLTKVLKGSYDQISFPDLEKETQEFIISLQASTGMLRIFMLSKADNHMPCLPPSWKSSKERNDYVPVEEINIHNGKIMGVDDTQTTIEREAHPKALEFSLTDMTPVKRTFVPDVDSQVADLKSKLNEEQKAKEENSKKLHQIEGLYAGLVEENKLLMREFKKKEDQVNDLVKQLQQTEDLLKKAEDDLKGNENLKIKKNWHQKEKNIKEKVKAVLSARDKESLNQRELVERVRDLEVVLEETVTERDKSLETLSMKVHDLSQQLDTADRQLRANKQFFEVQAAERDQEMDELIKANEKLRNELKERESLISQHHGLQREIRDLKQDIDSVEQQLSTKCSENENHLRRIEHLEEELKETEEKNIRIQHELEILSQKIQYNPSSRQNTNLISSEEDINHSQSHPRPLLVKQVSISEEIENSTRDLQCQTSLEENENTDAPPPETRSDVTQGNNFGGPDPALFEDLIDRLEKSTLGLESLQFTMMTGSGVSDEELSVREHLQLSETPNISKTRSLSPSSLEAKLEEKFLAFERSAEAAAKYAKDLEMRYCNLKAEYDDVINERDELNERLSVLSSIKSELDKASQESEFLRHDFDKKVQILKDQLASSKSKETELKLECKNLQSKIILKDEELRSTIIQDREQLMKEKDTFKTEIIELEKTIKEYLEEKEMYRKQNSEQLIKISCLEARLEDLKRSESPHEYELKTKINSLKGDLEKCREELTLKFREVEELRYSVKELKDQLIIREEQLDNLSRHKEYQSLPPSSKKEKRELAHALEGLESQKRVNQQLMEKLQKMKKEMRDSSSLSDGLISLIIDEKDATIRDISKDRKKLTDLIIDVLENLQNKRPIHEIIKMVRENLKISERCPSTRDSTKDDQEIQRGTPLQNPNKLGFKILDETEEFVPHITDPRLECSISVEGKERLSNNIWENLKLESIHSIQNNEFREGTSMKQTTEEDEKVKKLEADFEAAQEMLETKEEELQNLVAEVEDCVPMPPQNSAEINEVLFENDRLRKAVEDLQSQLQDQETSFERLQEFEKTSQELRKTLDENSRKNEELVNTKENLEEKISYLESQVEEKQHRIEKLKQDLELRNKEIGDLSTQVGQILTQFKDSNTKYKKQIKTLERDHFREMQDMKDKNIEREKQLCNEYEERLSSQVGELTLKLSREKEETLRNYQNHYEELLSKATKQKQNEQKVREEKSKNCSEEAQKEMQKKLEMAVGLDESFMSYLEKGVILSRESSVVSEGKDGISSVPDEERNICSRRLQSLIRKINQEGTQLKNLKISLK
ncbi:hypothetical protein Anas_05728 [Armadillidium nasatum]|uniref:Uncharacterized protein n=1 Tax=Armadillidium nasatum TaxID=96803 RepID=A0A5N5TMQ5_9CRUS|nr:hypothetical protein Anas_05728 [Armadillidium nasatum]